jgi:hypothetical protein
MCDGGKDDIQALEAAVSCSIGRLLLYRPSWYFFPLAAVLHCIVGRLSSDVDACEVLQAGSITKLYMYTADRSNATPCTGRV